MVRDIHPPSPPWIAARVFRRHLLAIAARAAPILPRPLSIPSITHHSRLSAATFRHIDLPSPPWIAARVFRRRHLLAVTARAAPVLPHPPPSVPAVGRSAWPVSPRATRAAPVLPGYLPAGPAARHNRRPDPAARRTSHVPAPLCAAPATRRLHRAPCLPTTAPVIRRSTRPANRRARHVPAPSSTRPADCRGPPRTGGQAAPSKKRLRLSNRDESDKLPRYHSTCPVHPEPLRPRAARPGAPP